MRHLNLFSLAVLLQVACLGLVLAGISMPTHAQSILRFEEVKHHSQSSDQSVVDKDGKLLQTVRVNWQRRQGQWLPLAQISPALLRLLLYAEDRRFYDHSGVDWYAVAGTAWSSLWGQRLRGTSTISMQLVDLLGLGAGRVAGTRSWSAKWEQAQLARQLESQWTKAQILEAYLNLVPFRGELIGVDAMATVLWQKQAFALSLPEAALAVAMLPSPNTSVSQLQQRSCLLWRGVQLTADCGAQRWYNQQALKRLAQPAWGNPNIAPHLAQMIVKNRALAVGGTYHSSVDKIVQQQGKKILHRHLADLREVNANDAALLVLHNATGQVVAYIGSSQFSAAARFDHVQALRQAGSTLKPFLYQLAIEQQRITAASLLADTSAQFSTPYGLYVPQNYDEQFMGWVSARVALASSINIPAVRLLGQVGVDIFQNYLQDLGFDLPYNADYYGLGLALGGTDLSLWQLTNAYRSLANLGVYSSICLTLPCSNSLSKRVATVGATWIVQQLLADNTARAATFGLDSALNTPFWTAVKTGTSKDMRDNWTIGFSEHYTVGVWVGNTDGSAMHEVSGVSGAAPIWHDMMLFLHQSLPSKAFPIPEQVLCQRVHFVQHNEAPRNECFIKGTERNEVRLQAQNLTETRIVLPLDQTIYAIDPDISTSQQQMMIEAESTGNIPIRWHINGKLVSDELHFTWPLVVGRHRIELLHQNTNQVLDTVSIEIRK